jgi:tRNA (mo5U34)-methyltransferase
MTDLQARIAAVPFWYHRIELPNGIVTPGWAPISTATYRIPERMDGQRVLDVGAWDGYWTFEAIRRGAAQVVAIDDFSDTLGKDGLSRTKWETFDLCCEALGYGAERVIRRELSVYDVSAAELGTFDTIFFFGTLYHLRHPPLSTITAPTEGLAKDIRAGRWSWSFIPIFSSGITNRIGGRQPCSALAIWCAPPVSRTWSCGSSKISRKR